MHVFTNMNFQKRFSLLDCCLDEDWVDNSRSKTISVKKTKKKIRETTDLSATQGPFVDLFCEKLFAEGKGQILGNESEFLSQFRNNVRVHENFNTGSK